MVARLYTGRGAHVADLKLPPFESGYPPILIWGVRTFLRFGGLASSNGVRHAEYHEAFAYVVPADESHTPDPERGQ